jgi:hypothetical protein
VLAHQLLELLELLELAHLLGVYRSRRRGLSRHRVVLRTQCRGRGRLLIVGHGFHHAG